MASERGRLVPTRRSRRLAGLGPLSSAGDRHMGETADRSDAAAARRTAADGRPSPARRSSDPTPGETSGSAGTSSGRHSAGSTAAVDPVPGPSSGRSTAASPSARSPGGLRSRGRRGVGAQRARRHEQGSSLLRSSLLRSYTEQLRTAPVQGESFCRCPQQGQSRDLHCVCGEDDHGNHSNCWGEYSL